MAPKKSRRPSRAQRPTRARRRSSVTRSSPDADPEIPVLLSEIQQVLNMPLSALMETARERAHAQALSDEAASSVAIGRLRELVAFIADGRPATPAGNLKTPDAIALARRLGTDADRSGEPRRMEDLPDTAHAFRWAVAAGFVVRRGSKIAAGPWASDLELDALSAWFKAGTTLLEAGVLDGFQQGWRKRYVEALDASVGDLLIALAAAREPFPLADIEQQAWEQVADGYGYERGDERERGSVVRLVRAMVAQLAQIGILAREEDHVVITNLGNTMAAVAGLSADDDIEGLDLIDTDAESLLLVCVEEMDPEEAAGHLLEWCQARPAEEAAAELCAAMLDAEDTEVWDLGFEALAMVDPAVAEREVRRLRSHPVLRALADQWLRRRGQARGAQPSE